MRKRGTSLIGVQDKRLYLPFYGKRGLLFIVVQGEAVPRLKCPLNSGNDAIMADTSYAEPGMIE
jgi:hypothetical protein